MEGFEVMFQWVGEEESGKLCGLARGFRAVYSINAVLMY